MAMGPYIAQRLLLAIPTILAISIITFVGLRVALPSDVVDLILGEYGAHDPELRANLEAELGLSANLPVQYVKWVASFLQGDMGVSLHNGRSISGELASRIPISFELGIWAQLTGIVSSIPLGVWAATRQDSFPDYGLRTMAILLNALPGFWIAILIITFGSLWFGWAPPLEFRGLFEDPVEHLKIMLIPGLIIGLTPSGGLIRLVRTQLLEVLRQDYIRTARAKGLTSFDVFYKHALRNALIPVVTVIGVGLPNIIAGTVLFEQIFGIPGMGRYLVTAVNLRDYPVIQAVNMIFAVLLVLSVIVVDVMYSVLDPRIRFR